MVDVTLDPNKEEEQTQAVAPVPQIRSEREIAETPQGTDPNVIQGLARSPYDESMGTDEQVRALFAQRERTPLGGFREPGQDTSVLTPYTVLPGPTGEIARRTQDLAIQRSAGQDPITKEQEYHLSKATHFYTLDRKRMAFSDPNMSIANKYRIMLRYEGGYLPKYDENGNKITVPVNGTEVEDMFTLTTTREYQAYTQPGESTGVVDDIISVGQDIATTVTGRVMGEGQLRELDQKLEKLGMKNRVARTLAMRGVATGRYEGDIVMKDLNDLSIFAMTLPPDIATGVTTTVAKFLTTEVIMEAVQLGVGGDSAITEEEFERRKEATAKGFDALQDFLSVKQAFDLQTLVEERSGQIYNPEIIEEIFAPRGVVPSLLRYGAVELGLYKGMELYKTAQATKRIPGLQKYLKETWETDDIIEAFNKARTAETPQTPKEVVQKYIETFTNEKVQRRVAEDLDIAFGLMVRQPGVERKELLQANFASIAKQVEETMATIKAARSTGKTDVVKRQQKVLAGLREQQQTLLYKELTPKYIRDLYAEAGVTVGATVAFTQLGQQFFGVQQGSGEMMTLEIGGALSSVVPLTAKLGTTKDMAAAGGRQGLYVLNQIAALARGVDFNPKFWEEFRLGYDSEYAKKLLKENKLNKDAMAVLRKVAEQPSEFQQAMMDGLKQHSNMRLRLVELGAKLNIDIDQDLTISNIATMSGIAELIDVSRQLDQRLVATGLEDIGGPIMEKRAVIQGQGELITQLAVATQKLLDVKLQAGLSDDDPISIMAGQMRGFVLGQQKRIDAERASLTELVKKNKETLHVAMEAVDVADDDLHRLLSDSYNDEINTIMDGMSAEVQSLVLTPQVNFEQSLNKIDELRQENFEFLDRFTRKINVGEASTGRAGYQFANLIAYRRSLIDGEVAKRYLAFDKDNADVHANVADTFDAIMLGKYEELDAVGTPAMAQGALRLEGATMIPSDRKAFASLFANAAKRGLNLMDQKSDGQLSRILSDLDLDGASPLRQWQELRRIAQEEPGRLTKGLDLTGEELTLAQGKMTKMINTMPMLVNSAEWRKVNSHLGKVIRSTDAGRQQAYFGLYDRWQAVGKKEIDGEVNGGAFMSGWLTGESPEIVADEVYEQFRSIQDYYRTQVIDRYTRDRQIKTWDAELNAKVKAASMGPASALNELDEDELLAEFARSFSKTDQDKLPTNWLDQLFTRVKKKAKTEGAPLSGLMLYDNFERALAKVGGVYDEATGEYRIIFDSSNPDEKFVGEVGKQLQAVVTRHMQGILAATFQEVLETDARGNKIFDPNLVLKYDENMFRSIFNIQVYTRDKNGAIVPAMKNGAPVRFVNEEEVFGAIGLTAYEKNRLDLVDEFKEADELVNTMEDEVIEAMTERGPRGEPIGIEALAQEEIAFVKSVQNRLFGMQVDLGLIAQARGDVSSFVTETELESSLYDMFINRDGRQDLSRLRSQLADDGYDPAYIDNFIQRSINNHINTNTQVYVGNNQILRADGVSVDAPQYEVSAQKIYNMIGAPDSAQRARLEQVLGTDAVEIWGVIADTIRKVDPAPSGSNIDAHVSSISLDSVLSRIYNINRGVVSVQWVATESIIRASRQHSGALLRAMLTDREVARQVLDIIETNKVPEYKTEPKWLRVLFTEVVASEARNEYSARDEAASFFFGITNEKPLSLQTYMERGVSPLELGVGERLPKERVSTGRVDPYAEMETRVAAEEAMPEAKPRKPGPIEEEFRKLGLSTKQFESQGVQQ